MRTIALVSQKGGVGKTSLATSLAVAALESGLRTYLIDLDPQRSAHEWGARRKRGGSLTVAALDKPERLPAVLAELRAQGVGLAILDCPGAFDTANKIAMQSVDLSLIPTRPAPLDIQASRKTVRALNAMGKAFAFVLNQCPPQPRNPRAKSAAMGLAMFGALAEPFILSRADYQDASGKGEGVTEWDPASRAAGEIRSLWQWTQNHISNLEEAA